MILEKREKIEKIEVTTGVYWLEVEKIGLRILCGTPADSIKHLMKRGLLYEKERCGVKFEMGPNAILLSDIMLQNGNFSNMSEFPVLQMLYRQGMILPNHPNNLGVKPLLIGSLEQIESQMLYIYRGNYGLISKEELLECEIDQKRALELMNLKLRFSFGKIKSTDELLDKCIVDNGKVEIRDGLFIERISTNIFEFSFEDEKISIDLNLKSAEFYPSPYPLGFYNIKREYFGVIHSGEADGWDPQRPCMSSILMYQGKIYLIDAGPNIEKILLALGIGINEIDGIFHTHSHDDHFAGITALLRGDRRVKYYATRSVRYSVIKKLSALLWLDESRFESFFDVCDLEEGVWNNIEGLEVKPIYSPHPVETTAFYFRTLWKGGFKSYAHLADIVSLEVLSGMIVDDGSKYGISKENYQSVKDSYLIKCDLKKVDIGGGLIHGNAEDFTSDKSKKIVLAHNCGELKGREKEIGSGAHFGSVDVLIPINQDYEWRYAYEFLRLYFSNVPIYEVRMLLNEEIVVFNPETIILKEGEKTESIYLALTGNVELIKSSQKRPNKLSAGTLIGEISALIGIPSQETYRASSYVQALRIDRELFFQFVKRNNLYSDIEKLKDKREFLQKTWLFGEEISYATQVKISKNLTLHEYKKEYIFTHELTDSIFLIKSGEVERTFSKSVVEVLSAGDYFGELSSVFNLPGVFKLKVSKDAQIYRIDSSLLESIPIVQWKLFETYQKRKRYILQCDGLKESGLSWSSELNINIQNFDSHHKHLVNISYAIISMLDENRDSYDELKDLFVALIEYSRFHFDAEEFVFRQYKYKETQTHTKEHRKIEKEMKAIEEELKRDGVLKNREGVKKYLKSWVIDHINRFDKHYSDYFHKKGIY